MSLRLIATRRLRIVEVDRVNDGGALGRRWVWRVEIRFFLDELDDFARVGAEIRGCVGVDDDEERGVRGVAMVHIDLVRGCRDSLDIASIRRAESRRLPIHRTSASSVA